MKKKAAALAVGALFAAPAAHAQITLGNETIGTVQVYGKVYPQYSQASGHDSTQGGSGVSTLVGTTNAAGVTTLAGGAVADHLARNSVDVGNSYIGFRGERALGGTGLKGIWQLEQSTNFDTGTGTFASRNSFAGLSHKTMGTVKLGNMDSIYKEYGDLMQMFGVASGNFISASNVLSHIGVGSNNNARFHERYTNTVQYQTAEFGGIQAGLQYMPDETKGNPGNNLNKHIWSYGVKYDSQMFYVSLHQEQKWDFLGYSSQATGATAPTGAISNSLTTSHSRDMATRLSGEFRFLGSQRIVLDISRLHYYEYGSQTRNGQFQEYKKPTFALGYDGGFGAWRFATEYVRAGAGTCQLTGGVDCSTTGLQSWLWTVGGRYRFDRQTFVYLIAAKLSNGASAAMSNNTSFTANRGEDTKQIALGVSYSF